MDCLDPLTDGGIASRLAGSNIPSPRRLTFYTECITATSASAKDRLTLSISVAVGSTIVSLCLIVNVW